VFGTCLDLADGASEHRQDAFVVGVAGSSPRRRTGGARLALTSSGQEFLL